MTPSYIVNSTRNTATFYSRFQADNHIAYLRKLGCSRITEVQHSDGSIVVMWYLAPAVG